MAGSKWHDQVSLGTRQGVHSSTLRYWSDSASLRCSTAKLSRYQCQCTTADSLSNGAPTCPTLELRRRSSTRLDSTISDSFRVLSRRSTRGPFFDARIHCGSKSQEPFNCDKLHRAVSDQRKSPTCVKVREISDESLQSPLSPLII